jgi:hypothetical protein
MSDKGARQSAKQGANMKTVQYTVKYDGAEHYLSSNEYWHGVNKRTDKRCRLLYRLGFRLQSAYTEDGKELGVACMVKRHPRRPNRLVTIAMPAISWSPKQAWIDYLKTILQS